MTSTVQGLYWIASSPRERQYLFKKTCELGQSIDVKDMQGFYFYIRVVPVETWLVQNER